MLLLFDIDGTLVRTDGAGRTAFELALREVAGIDNGLQGVRLHGNTDPQILASALANAGHPADAVDMHEVFERYAEILPGELEARMDTYTVLPGAVPLLEACRSAGYELGLATGNIEVGARHKLRPGGLDAYFAFGGFGSDAGERSELVRAALGRSSGAWSLEQTVVLGDTERDVAAARAVGVRCVGVLAGASEPDVLRDAEPDLVAESFEDPDLWSWLGLQT